MMIRIISNLLYVEIMLNSRIVICLVKNISFMYDPYVYHKERLCSFFFFPTVLLTEVEYVVDVELNITDVATLAYLRNILSNASFSMDLASGDNVNVTQIIITTGQNSFPSDIIHNHGNGHLCSV